MMKKAFTLVELLVVIAIIALLMAILIPSLQAARGQAQRVVCLSSLGQLGLAWVCYAQDNDGMITYACPTYSYTDTDLGATYTGWVAGYTSEQGIKDGALYKYATDLKLYVCPARRNSAAVLTYSIVDSMNGHRGFSWESEKPPYKSLLRIKNAARRTVFADEDAMKNSSDAWITTSESYTINYTDEKWWDKPSGKHIKGMNYSFADGHAEYLRYVDKRTVEMAKIKHKSDWTEHLDGDGNQDLYRFQIYCWGKLGYDNPQETPIW